ncbi:MAG: bifunctional diguanylate cyclase/phosphodiesterase [Nitrospirae bacterium]|nr:bifunctional diguanylate cyclase/phosphodiesterase [Nitrospirota bacterium]
MTDEIKTKEELIAEVQQLRFKVFEMEKHLEYLSHFDTLTDLPNRALFIDRVEQYVTSARRYGFIMAVIFLGVDRFKMINQSFGHDLGDIVLKEISSRLAACVRDSDTVGRMSGDEFALILSKIAKEEDAVIVANKIISSMRKAFIVDGREISLSASVGITLYPSDGKDADTLTRNASTAMRRVKETTGDNYNFFTSMMNDMVSKRLTLESSLRKALERDEMHVFYQPQFDVSSQRVIGMEALIRWIHPEHGMISPLNFIPLAEETGLIVPIGEWVLRTACSQTKAWIDEYGPMRVGVNLSMRQFKEKNMIDTVSRALIDSGLDSKYLELELTESTAMHDADGTIAVINELKNLGITVSIDDFGTGYSSLSYLKNLPISTLKIDQSFIKSMTENKNDTAIVKAIINMAHSLTLNVIAEGVETEQHLNILGDLKCDEVQGYFFSKPLPVAEFEKLLKMSKKG